MKRLVVFAEKKIKGGTVLVRAGNAIENRDGSIVVHLDVLPLEGKLILRLPVGTERSESEVSAITAMLGQAIGVDRCKAMAADLEQCALHVGHTGEHLTELEVRRAREVAGK